MGWFLGGGARDCFRVFFVFDFVFVSVFGLWRI